ncbi:hypothetical protein B1748_32250 [Paenibacillus sp. MY03]|uniref:hypothetical protein n=1 Tax=Paenibacillus sp. MY03 TaxID=302980 RepID=UPI000B3BEEBC|nr:hypothetical protein [Paenibacillus sp. MY03]OUS69095.1 hypothetical protein B1748_32250 [Paenibacillus sp. MY03]
MKSWYRLWQYEFSLLFRGTLLLAIGAVVTPLLFLHAEMGKDYAEIRRYEHLFAESGALASLLVYFVALLALFLKSIYSGYWGGKSMYAMLTLPVRRESLYLGKLAAFAVSMLVFWAASVLGIWLGFGLLDDRVLHATNGIGVPANGMFLAVIRSDYLRLIIPYGWQGLLSTISIGTAMTTGIYYGVLCERSKRYWGLFLVAGSLFLVIRVLIYRIGLPHPYLTAFNLNASSVALLIFVLWFAGHSIRLMRRGAIV